MENDPQTLLTLREFNLVTTTPQPTNATGLYLASFHTGAGDSALVGTRDAAHARPFYLNSTYIDDDINAPYLPQGSFAVGLQPYPPRNSSAPVGLLAASDAAVESHTPGFRVGEGDVVVYEGDVGFETFVVCWVDGIVPYKSVGPQWQVLWRNRTTERVEGGGCEDVELKAVFLS